MALNTVDGIWTPPPRRAGTTRPERSGEASSFQREIDIARQNNNQLPPTQSANSTDATADQQFVREHLMVTESMTLGDWERAQEREEEEAAERTEELINQAEQETEDYIEAVNDGAPQDELDRLYDAANQQWGLVQGSAANELRLAAHHAGSNPDQAIEDKAEDITSRLPDDTLAGEILDEIVEEIKAPLKGETAQARETELALYEFGQAYENLQERLAAQEEAGNLPSEMLEGIPEIEEQAQANVDAAMAALNEAGQVVEYSLGSGLEGELTRLYPDAEIYSNEQIAEAVQHLKNRYAGRGLDQVIDGVATGRELAQAQQQVQELLDEINPDTLNETERRLWDSLRQADVALLRALGVSFETRGDTTLAIVNGQEFVLHDQEEILAQEDPVNLALLLVGGVRLLDSDGPTGLTEIQIEVDGEGTTPEELIAELVDANLLSEDDAQSFQTMLEEMLETAPQNPVGLAGLAEMLAPFGNFDRDTQLLIAGAEQVRLDSTQERVEEHMRQGDEQGAKQILLANMDAAFSEVERQVLWEEVGLPHFGPDHFAQQLDQITQEYGDSPDYATEIGHWLLEQAEGMPPEMARVVLDVVMDKVDLDKFQHGQGAFFNGLSELVTIADQRPDPNHTTSWGERTAAWLIKPTEDYPEGFPFMPTDIAYAITEGYGTGLSEAYINRIESMGLVDPDHNEYRLVFDDTVVPPDPEAVDEGFQAFERNKDTIVPDYFNSFSEAPSIGTPQDLVDGPALRNMIGQALGLTPTNRTAADNTNNNVEWYTAREESAIIDQVVSWIFSEAGIDEEGRDSTPVTITAIPIIYQAERDGVDYGALFHVRGPERETTIRGHTQTVADEFVIDGSVAKQFIDVGDDGEVTPRDDVNMPYRYDGLKHFQGKNYLSDKGHIYLPYHLVKDLDLHGLELFEPSRNGEVEVGVITANLVTTSDKVWEKIDIGVTIASFAAMFIPVVGLPLSGILRAVTLARAGTWTARLATAPRTASLTRGALYGNMAYTAGRGAYMLQEMHDLGMSIGWSNPMARSIYIEQIGTLAGGVSIGGSAAFRRAFAGSGSGRAARAYYSGTQVANAIDLGTGAYLTLDGYRNLIQAGDEASGFDWLMLSAGAAQLTLGTWGIQADSQEYRQMSWAAETRQGAGNRENGLPIHPSGGGNTNDAALGIPGSEATDRGFTVRATPERLAGLRVRRETADDLFYTRTRLTLREKFGQWMQPNGEAASRSIVRLSDQDFNNRLMEVSGRTSEEVVAYEGFYHPPTRTIYMRESAPGSFNRVNRHNLGHEMLHDASNDNFMVMAFSLVNPRTGSRMVEGATEYLTFKAFGPPEFANREFGFHHFIEDAKARGNPIPGYHMEVKAAELIFELHKSDAYKAFFLGDRIELFRQEALRLGFVERDIPGSVMVVEARRSRPSRTTPPVSPSGVPRVPGAGPARPGPVVRARQSFTNARTELGFQIRYGLSALKMFGIDPALRPVKFVGRKFHDGVPYVAFLLPMADLAAHPWMSTRVREDIGAANFAARGPILVVLAVATAKRKLSAVTRLGSTLRASAGSMFIMNAVGNSWKVAESVGDGLNASLAYQAFFATAQGLLGARSLYASYQGRKYARWSGLWDNPAGPAKKQLDNSQGMSWREAARTTGVPRKELKRENLGDAILVPDWGGNIMTRPKTLTSRSSWAALAAKFGVPEAALRQVNGNATGKRPKQNDILVPVVGRVPHGASWRSINRLVRDLARLHGVSSKSIKDLNGIGKSIRSQKIKVPDYVWDRDSQTGRWLQVAGAGNMAAASFTLGFVDHPVWGWTDMAFVGADAAIFVGTGGTAFMAGKSKNGQTLSKRYRKIFALFQSISAFALAWKGLGHLLARGGVMGPDIQNRDIHQIEN